MWLAGAPIVTVFSVLFSSSSTPEQLSAAARGWALARRSAVASGYIGTVLGAVIIGKNIDDINALGPGMAIGILTLLYGLVIGYGFCLPCQYHIESRVTQ
jgi:chemotaxis protein MotA